jgi:hypothetical protein
MTRSGAPDAAPVGAVELTAAERWLVTAVVVAVAALLLGGFTWRLAHPRPVLWTLSINGGDTDCYRLTTGAPRTDVFAGKSHVSPLILKFSPGTRPHVTLADIRVPLRVVWVGSHSTVIGSDMAGPAATATLDPPGPATLAVVLQEGTHVAVANSSMASGQWWAAVPPTVKLGSECGSPPVIELAR